VDLPGFGLSHAVKFEQSVTAQARFLREFLDAIGFGVVDLLGNSMGGWVALKFAREYPDRLRKLVLVAPAGIRFTPPPLEVFKPDDEAGMRRLLSHLFHRPPDLPRWFVRDWLRLSRQRRSAVRDMLDSMVTGQDLLDGEVGRILTPTLILWGEHDRLIPSETGRRLVTMLPDARLEVISDAGHLILHEALPEASRRLESWLD
jgi:pimeloyl-ACP methyl ester carboxylesterase